MHTLCVLRRREVERFANKVSIQMIPLKVESRHWHCQLRAIYNKQLHVNKTHFIVSIFLHTYMCVLLVLRLFLVKYCFFNRWEETFKLFVNLLIPNVKFSQPPKIGDITVSRVHTCWFCCFECVWDEIIDEIIYDCK